MLSQPLADMLIRRSAQSARYVKAWCIGNRLQNILFSSDHVKLLGNLSVVTLQLKEALAPHIIGSFGSCCCCCGCGCWLVLVLALAPAPVVVVLVSFHSQLGSPSRAYSIYGRTTVLSPRLSCDSTYSLARTGDQNKRLPSPERPISMTISR